MAPAGPAGATGSQGPQGPQGPVGPPGQVLYLDGGSATTEDVEIAGYTSATYTGDLGGIPGANAKCNAEFAGSFFCTMSDFWRSEPSVGPAGNAWVDSDRDSDGNRTGSSCYTAGTWTNGTNSDTGLTITPVGGYINLYCNNARPLACCQNQ